MGDTVNCADCSAERKPVGKVTPKECEEIQSLFERRNGLAELVKALVETEDEVLENCHFYEKIVADMGATATKHQQWWDRCAQKYRWESLEGYLWEIDFETCRIFLRKA